MTLRTITFDDSIYKLVPLEPTVQMMEGCFDGISLSDAHSPYGVEEHVYSKMIAAAPEYQDTCKFDRGMCGIGGYCKDCIQDTKKDE